MLTHPLNKLVAIGKIVFTGLLIVVLVAPPVFSLGVLFVFVLLVIIQSLIPSVSLPEWVIQFFSIGALPLWSIVVLFCWFTLVCIIAGIAAAASENTTKDVSSFSYQSTDDYEGDDWRGYASHVQDTMFRH